ncbi:MAG: hypothetical protein ABIH38_01825 [Patescibacteria group bacterium]
MKKFILNTTKLTNFLNKYYYLLIVCVFCLVIIFDLIFVFLQINNNDIDPSKIVSREQKIDQTAYDQVIKRDENKKQPGENIDKLNNPF